jgi:sulfur carrier protein
VTQSLRINGTERQFPERLQENLAALLSELKIDQATVVAEIDGQIIERKDFAVTPLKSGQSIELVRFVGGG